LGWNLAGVTVSLPSQAEMETFSLTAPLTLPQIRVLSAQLNTKPETIILEAYARVGGRQLLFLSAAQEREVRCGGPSFPRFSNTIE
jgi:hypothetical protein